MLGILGDIRQVTDNRLNLLLAAPGVPTMAHAHIRRDYFCAWVRAAHLAVTAPPMAAGITDRLRSVTDIVPLIEAADLR